jgi:hypothetical protein
MTAMLASRIGRAPDLALRHGRPGRTIVILHRVRGVIAAVKADLGCLLVSLLFILIMASSIIFATVLTPPAHNPFV